MESLPECVGSQDLRIHDDQSLGFAEQESQQPPDEPVGTNEKHTKPQRGGGVRLDC